MTTQLVQREKDRFTIYHMGKITIKNIWKKVKSIYCTLNNFQFNINSLEVRSLYSNIKQFASSLTRVALVCNNNFQETLNILKINCAKNILNIKFHILFGVTNFSLHLKEIRLMHAMVIGLPTKDQTWEMLQENL